MVTAHLIVGYIGAGKTTYARQLAEEFGAIRFTTDEWIARLYSDDESQIPDFGVLIDRVEPLMRDVWRECLSRGVDVVLDQGFWTRSKRDQARRDAASCGAGVRLYHLCCPDDEAWARVERRNADPRGSIRMARNTFDVLRARFEPLGADEDHIAIDTG